MFSRSVMLVAVFVVSSYATNPYRKELYEQMVAASSNGDGYDDAKADVQVASVADNDALRAEEKVLNDAEAARQVWISALWDADRKWDDFVKATKALENAELKDPSNTGGQLDHAKDEEDSSGLAYASARDDLKNAFSKYIAANKAVDQLGISYPAVDSNHDDPSVADQVSDADLK